MFGGPLKKLQGPLVARGPPVEKHCSKAVVLNLFGWRPTEQNYRQFGDPFITIIVLKTGFGDPKVRTRDPLLGRDPPVEKH